MTCIVRWKESIGRLKSQQRGVATIPILKFEWEKKFEFKSTFPRTASHIHVLQYFVARHHRWSTSPENPKNVLAPPAHKHTPFSNLGD